LVLSGMASCFIILSKGGLTGSPETNIGNYFFLLMAR
jgi:hypothetical protein